MSTEHVTMAISTEAISIAHAIIRQITMIVMMVTVVDMTMVEVVHFLEEVV